MKDLLKYLPYILPTRTISSTDKKLEITSRYFRLAYNDLILSLLWHINILPQSAKYIKKSCLKDVINQVTFFIHNYCDGEYFSAIEQLKTYKQKLHAANSFSR